MWNQHRLVADDGTAETDVGGMEYGQRPVPQRVAAVGLPAGGKKITHCKAVIEITKLE
jgi:hypothetical protein